MPEPPSTSGFRGGQRWNCHRKDGPIHVSRITPTMTTYYWRRGRGAPSIREVGIDIVRGGVTTMKCIDDNMLKSVWRLDAPPT